MRGPLHRFFSADQRLRVDHGAIAALRVPTPTPALVGEILSVLVR